MLPWLSDEDRQDEFIEDLKEIVENPDVDLWSLSYNQVVENDNEEKTNCLFVLEKVMVELGILSSKKVPSENCLAIDPFTSSYTTYDMILVVCFLYISIIEKGAMRNPGNHRLVQNEGLVRRRRVTEDEVNERNDTRGYYKENKVGRQKLRDRWISIEDKLVVHHWKWLQEADKKSKNEEDEDEEDNQEQLLKHTKARETAFKTWDPSAGTSDGQRTNVPVNSFMSMSNGVRKEDVLVQIKAMQGRR